MRADEVETAAEENPSRPGDPWWPVALGISGFLALVLGLGFYASVHWRPPIGPVAATSGAVDPGVRSSTIPLTPVGSEAPHPALAASPMPYSTATASTVSFAVVGTMPTGSPAGSVTGQTPTPFLRPGTPVPFHPVDSALDREVEGAYRHFWEVQAAALLHGDPSRLGEVLADPELTRDTDYVRGLEAQGRGLKVDVQHQPLGIYVVSADGVWIYDEYAQRSVVVDLRTGSEIPAAQPQQSVKLVYVLRRIDGIWKVTDGLDLSG